MYSAPFYSGWNGSRLNGVQLAVCRGLQNGMACRVAVAGASGMEWWRVGELLHQWGSNMVQSTCFYKQYTVRKSANNEKYIPKMLKSKKNEIANNLNNTLPASSCLLTAQYARSLTE